MTHAKQRQGTRGARKPVKTTMADYAMSFERLGQWMSERARSPTLRHPQATSLSMLDGAVAAVVAGPVSIAPEEWVCPLLGVDPDAFNHDTEEFSAIAATNSGSKLSGLVDSASLIALCRISARAATS